MTALLELVYSGRHSVCWVWLFKGFVRYLPYTSLFRSRPGLRLTFVGTENNSGSHRR